MPRYFFDLDNQEDMVGAELPSDEAARQEAALRALNGTGHQIGYKNFKEIVVRTEAGDLIYRAKVR